MKEDEKNKLHFDEATPGIYELLKQKAKEMRKNPTPAETAMWEMLRAHKFGAKFRRQHIVGDFIVDFVCRDAKLIVEVDGEYHNSPEQQEWEQNRTEYLKRRGYKVIRFTNDQVLYDTHKVISQISEALSPSHGAGHGGATPSTTGRAGEGQGWAIEQLERQGCWCEDWSRISISHSTDLRKIRNVYFRGDVAIGDNAEIINVPGGLANVRIGDNVRIVNVARIERTPDATFGIGTDINVLDETGSRPVRIYPGISSQIATLAARMPDFATERLFPIIDAHIADLPDMPEIGDGAEIINCGDIVDVRVWPGVRIEGSMHLRNGSIINNSGNGMPLAFVGQGVDGENFIIEDGVVSGGALIRNVYVGQGSFIDKDFTAHDSLFFANCSMECGEACAVLAGPYSVSMHKSSLLIGVQTSFFNAGSGTNMSNHMYKTGPVHWGVFERGVKTSSNAYVMHGSRIGAYSLVMGDHKYHPDTSDFPFSYLLGDARGHTTVIPGAMLKSYGLRRDEAKWPIRDRRLGHGIPLHDLITFSVLNPYSIGKIHRAIDIITSLLAENADNITYNGLRLSRRHLSSALSHYRLCMKQAASAADPTENYIDLGGLIVDRELLSKIKETTTLSEIIALLQESSSDSGYNLSSDVPPDDAIYDYPL